jgi:AraC-like DNA-binding protein
MVGCLGNDEARGDSVAQRLHELIMRRFRRVVEENPGQPLYDAEICKAIGVSERTLWVRCQEKLGWGPKRYLLFSRLHLPRPTMREASAGPSDCDRSRNPVMGSGISVASPVNTSPYSTNLPPHTSSPSRVTAASISRNRIARRFSHLPQSLPG